MAKKKEEKEVVCSMASLSLRLLKNEEEVLKKNNLSYRIKKNDIEFLYDNISYIVRISNLDAFLVRESPEFKFVLDIRNQKCFYNLKETNTLLEIEVLKSNAILLENKFIIEYELETDEGLNKVEFSFKKGE